MATFKVGQRVRIIFQEQKSVSAHGSVIGREATIVAIPSPLSFEADCDIQVDGSGVWFTKFEHLAPLTDTAADQFIERIKKLGREPVIIPEKVTV